MPELAEETVIGFIDSMSNWGRWGIDDERGALNLITPARVLAAVQLAQLGIVVACGRTVEFAPKINPTEAPLPPLHFMLQSGESASSTGMDTSNDWVALPLHGLHLTHLDAYAHLFWKGRMYNGRSAGNVTTMDGAKSGSVAVASTGIVTRGMLLDIPMVRGVEALDNNDRISFSDLEAAERATGVSLQPGDLAFVRTGYGSHRSPTGASIPGMDANCLPFLRAREPAIVASDTATDSVPTQYSSIPFPIHAVCIVAMGVLIIDNCDLERLSQTCRQLGRWEFLVTVACIDLANATSSPVNPLAIF
jgi:kynurenine formamidase